MGAKCGGSDGACEGLPNVLNGLDALFLGVCCGLRGVTGGKEPGEGKEDEEGGCGCAHGGTGGGYSVGGVIVAPPVAIDFVENL